MSDWTGYLIRKNHFIPVPYKYMAAKRVMDLITGPYVLKFNLTDDRCVYFTDDEGTKERFEADDKFVYSMTFFFERLKEKLSLKGFPVSKAVLGMTMEDLWAHEAVLDVYDGVRYMGVDG